MAETYTERREVERPTEGEEGFLTDRRVKLIGMAAAGLFTAGVVFFLFLILTQFVDYDLLVTIIPQFVDALLLVLEIILISGVLSLVFGVLVGLGRVSKTGFTQSIATLYVEFFRGTPLLFQLFVVYIGIPALWTGGQFPISNWSYAAAIIGLTLNHTAYIGEAVKGGINSVPEGQTEAARSLGMSYIDSMRFVILPQAWRNALAAIGNDLVILVKDTSLLTVLAIPELISVFRSVNSATFDAWTPIVVVSVAYLVITVPLGKLVRTMEERSMWGTER
ncbi:amino acid ABC transporter permease [Haladaptatus salinisoli]|uniref:amino acid ABC transporter permease n=1 Tax=Haladaptatus salinisoli TaxID=2884876 RepID=UPI001D0B5F2A|nr:amino acid ABC transporter permease [Haladaptatus salinisoli]